MLVVKLRLSNHHKAVEYIYRVLSKQGKTLSKIFLKKHNLKRGEIFTIVPQNTFRGKLYNFEEGIMPQGKKHKIKTKNGDYVLIERVITTKDWLINWLYNYLKYQKNLILIFEGILELTNEYKHILIYRQEFYYIVLGGKLIKKSLIKDAINKADPFPIRGFIVSVNYNWLLNRYKQKIKITKQELTTLVENTNMLIIGAYDFESFLIWTIRDDK